MGLKDFFEAFGGKPVSEIIYLFTLVVIWMEFVFPRFQEFSRFFNFFMVIIFVLFIISKVVLLNIEMWSKEKEGVVLK